jgi:hypothetical protein
MRRRAQSPGSLYALAVAIEAAAARDPYPRLTEFMQARAAPAPEPYPRLAGVMQHLAARELQLAL